MLNNPRGREKKPPLPKICSKISKIYYRVTASFNLAKKKAKQVKNDQEQPTKTKKYVVPKFEQPTVIKEDDRDELNLRPDNNIPYNP